MADVTHFSPRGQFMKNLSDHGYGGLWFLLILVASLPVFWYGFVSLGDAWATPEYSHGPIIPILSLYLFLRDMRKVPPVDHKVTRWPGVVVIVAALAIAVFGNLIRIPDIVTYGFIIWVAGMVLLCFGFSRGLLFWTGVLHLVYMLPLPQFLYWHLTIYLQLISSELGVWFIEVMGISVFLDGNIIDLGVYKLQVAEACSGLRYLFPILSFSYVFCVLYNGPKWHKIVILLSAAPITIFMNAFRIGVIGVLVENFGIEHAEGFLHYFEGWVIFGACVGLLFLLAVVMQRLQKHPKPLAEALDIDFDGLGEQAMRATQIPINRMLVAVGVLTTVASIIWVLLPQPEYNRVQREPFGFFPTALGEWSGSTIALDASVEYTLGADDYIQTNYIATGEAAPVGFFSAFYHKQTEGSGIHSPEVCLPVGGWEMFDVGQITIDLEDTTGWAPFQTNRAIIQKGTQKQVVYYWFEQRGKRMTNDFKVKLATIADSLTINRADGALVRFTTHVVPGETVAAADARIMRLMAETLPVLPKYLPE